MLHTRFLATTIVVRSISTFPRNFGLLSQFNIDVSTRPSLSLLQIRNWSSDKKKKQATALAPLKENVINVFNKDVFSRQVLRSYLTEERFQEFMDCLENYKELSPELADLIAHAMKEWANSKGATHFTHWFQPMTGASAEKHDSFLDWNPNEQQFIAKFTGKRLIKGESDASSFPSGGTRATFEARGYTIWDLSPAYIKRGVNGNILYIPTAFASWKGDALDSKTPLLRSEKILSDAAVRLIKAVDPDTSVKSTQSEVGAEQEFFLIEKEHFHRRPDLLYAGRTVIGTSALLEQQHGFHYFGPTPPRVLAFMQESEIELSKVGIPMLARHNEVAPGQFELAPIFERSPVASDHNMMLIDIIKKVANKHGFECLIHEKPFARVNGSGKHLNYSISTNEGENVFVPGKTPHQNLRFLVFLAAMIRGVHLYGDLLRAATAVPGNDYRLGAHEAPPSVISIYLGSELEEVCQFLMGNIKELRKREDILKFLGTHLPPLRKDSSDRNRTSPFAFTGNRFEFRAVGSSQSVAIPVMILNAIMADSCLKIEQDIKEKVEILMANNSLSLSEARASAISLVVSSTLHDHYSIIYNEDLYSDEYIQEAKKRGLPNLKRAPQALAAWEEKKNVHLLERMGVLTRREQEARSLIVRETFLGQLLTEVKAALHLSRQHVLPSALRQQHLLASSLSTTKRLLREGCESQEKDLSYIKFLIKEIHLATQRLEDLLEEERNSKKDIIAKFSEFHPLFLEGLSHLRSQCDSLEEIVQADLWTLPTYNQMLIH